MNVDVYVNHDRRTHDPSQAVSPGLTHDESQATRVQELKHQSGLCRPILAIAKYALMFSERLDIPLF